MSVSNKRLVAPFCVFLIGATLFWYWSNLFNYVPNAPDSDDFVDVLWFFEVYFLAEDWRGVLYSLFLPIHEHITFINHLFYLLDYSLFKQVNFIHYVLIGNVLILALCGVLACWLAKQTGYLLALTIVISCYLTIFYWHSSFWAMTSISNHVVILFASLAALSIERNPDKLWPVYLCAVLATASQANGLAVFIAIGFVALVYAWRESKTVPWLKIIVPVAVMFTLLFFYTGHQDPFQHHHHLDHQALTTEPELIHMYQRDISGVDGLKFSFLYFVTSFLAFCGATIFTPELAIGSVLLGAVVLGFIIYTAIRSPQYIDRFSWMMLVFVLVSVFLISYARGGYGGPLAALQPRYKMYSLLLFLLAANILLKKATNKQPYIYALLSCGILIQISSQSVLASMAENRAKLVDSYYNWIIDGGMGRSTMMIYPPNQDQRLFNAYRGGYYNPYEAIENKHKPVQIKKNLDTPVCRGGSYSGKESKIISVYSKKPKALATELTLDLPATTDKKLNLLFCGNNIAYEMTLGERNINAETNTQWPIIVMKKDLPAGKYKVFQTAADENRFLGSIKFR